MAACSPVPHACCRSNAGVYGDSALPSTHSRIRLKSRLCLSTAPPIDRAQPFARQVEAVDQAAERGGEHVLVRRLGVGAVGACERNAIAAEDRHATIPGGPAVVRGGGGHGCLRVVGLRMVPVGSYYPLFLLWSKFVVDTSTVDTRGSSVAPEAPSDLYSQVVNSGPGSFLAKQLGVPQPETLRRYRRRRSAAGRAAADRRRRAGWPNRCAPRWPRTTTWSATTSADGGPTRSAGCVFDATGITATGGAERAARVLHPTAAQPRPLGTRRRGRHHARSGRQRRRAHRPARAGGLHPLARQGVAARRHGALVYLAPDAKPAATGLESTMRFMLSAKSAYVDGQVFYVGRRRLHPTGRLGQAARRARSRSSPARPAASARPSPRCSPATAPRSSASTSTARPRHSPRPPPRWAAPR